MVLDISPVVRFLNAGDAALVIEFGSRIEQSTLGRVSAMNAQICSRMQSGELVGIVETVPTFRSLALILDPLITSPDAMTKCLKGISEQAGQEQNTGRHWLMPVHYGGADAPDLDALSTATGLHVDKIIERHLETHYSVYMLGFQPGFGFMGDVHESIRQPRRREPRTRVPAGSVAIANQLTAIYPWESPGGWHLIGRCPVPLFDPKQDPPALFRAGDTVEFRRIGKDECTELERRSERFEIDKTELQITADSSTQVAHTHAAG